MRLCHAAVVVIADVSVVPASAQTTGGCNYVGYVAMEMAHRPVVRADLLCRRGPGWRRHCDRPRGNECDIILD